MISVDNFLIVRRSFAGFHVFVDCGICNTHLLLIRLSLKKTCRRSFFDYGTRSAEIFQKFVKVLGEQGVKKIETENADFNTDLHEAIAQVPAPSDEMKGKIIDCVKTGYTLNEKVIRHSQVAVGL